MADALTQEEQERERLRLAGITPDLYPQEIPRVPWNTPADPRAHIEQPDFLAPLRGHEPAYGELNNVPQEVRNAPAHKPAEAPDFLAPLRSGPAYGSLLPEGQVTSEVISRRPVQSSEAELPALVSPHGAAIPQQTGTQPQQPRQRAQIAAPNVARETGAPMPKFPQRAATFPQASVPTIEAPLPATIQPPPAWSSASRPNETIPNLQVETPQTVRQRTSGNVATPFTPQQKLEQLTSSPPGYQQIHNPILHGLAATGNALASIFPRVGVAIPGTTAHHNELIGEQEALLNQQAGREHLAGETAETQARAEAIGHPRLELEMTDAGLVRVPQEGEAQPVTMGGKPLQKPEPEKASLAETAEGRAQLAEQYGLPLEDKRTYILTGKLPTEPKDNRDDKAIAIYSKPKSQWTPEEQQYVQGYEAYVNKTKVQPGVMRMEVLGNIRQYPTVGENGQAVWSSANAINQANAAGNPSLVAQYSPTVQGNVAAGKEAVKGVPVIQTALHHLDQMDKAGKALDMGNVKALNEIAKAYQVQIGDEPLATFRGIQQIIRGDILAASSAVGAKNENEEKAIDAITDPANPPKAIHASIGAIRQLMTDRLKAKGEVYQQLQGGQNIFTPQTEASQVKAGTDFGPAPAGAKEGKTGKFNGTPFKVVGGRMVAQ